MTTLRDPGRPVRVPLRASRRGGHGQVAVLRRVLALCALLPALLSTACARSPRAPQGPAPTRDFVFVCADGTRAVIRYPADDDAATARLSFADRRIALERARSASGARYTAGTFTWWEKGGVAFMEEDGTVIHDDCRVLQPPAQR